MSDHPFFTNKVFIVTGASSGLGLQIAQSLSERGARTVLFSRNLSALKKDIKDRKDGGVFSGFRHPSLLITGDVTDERDVKRCIQKVVKEFGRIDGMVLNAGKSMWKQFLDLDSLEEVREIMEVNFWGVVNFCFHGLPYIKESQGRLVIISSLQSIIGVPYHTGYAASKHALNGFIESLYLEEGISVLNVIASWIRGTSLRKNSIGFRGEMNHNSRHGIFSISVEDCAARIVDAIPLPKKTISLPRIVSLFPLVKFFFPNWLAKRVKKTVDKEIKKSPQKPFKS